MNIKTRELSGTDLDVAVAIFQGATDTWRSDGPFLWNGVPCISIDGHDVRYTPSTNWSHGGPIIEREEMTLACRWQRPYAIKIIKEGPRIVHIDGPTPLIAAMRCFVASKLGEEVEIPEDLK